MLSKGKKTTGNLVFNITQGPIYKITRPNMDFNKAEQEQRNVDEVLQQEMETEFTDPRKISLQIKNEKFLPSLDNHQSQASLVRMQRKKIVAQKKIPKTQLGPELDQKQFLMSPQSLLSQGTGSLKQQSKFDWAPQDTKDQFQSRRSNLVPKQITAKSLFNVVVKGTLGEEFTEFELYQENSEPEEIPKNVNFANGGMRTNKQLKNYDCWDEDRQPEEWLAIVKAQDDQNKLYHAKVPIYDKSGKYLWTGVQILGYDPETRKYKVRVVQTGVEKEVGRLSLLFEGEDPVKFEQRVELCKQRQKNADDEMRFLEYVNNQSNALASNLSNEMQQKIEEFSQFRPLPYLTKDDPSKTAPGFPQISNLNKEEKPQIQDPEIRRKQQQNLQNLKIDLVKQVQTEYILLMKKCAVVKDMEINKNDPKWIKHRIRNRHEVHKKNFFGLYEQLYYDFNQIRSMIGQQHYCNKKQIVDTLNAITERSQLYQNFPLLNILLNQNTLPLTLQNFESSQKQHQIQGRQTLQVQWRSTIYGDIQDKLRDFRFFQTETEKYYQSELQRLLMKIDYMFNSFLRENVLRQNCESWVNFIKKFTYPPSQGEGIWKINDYPMIILNLEVNLQFKRKKDVRKKKDEKEKEPSNVGEEEESPINFSPSFQQVFQVLIKPIEMLVESVNQFNKLEKDLVPLVDIDYGREDKGKVKAYEITQDNYWIQWAIKQVYHYVTIGFEKPNELLQKFRKYSFLLEKSSTSLMKQLFGDSTSTTIAITNLDQDIIQQKLQDFIDAKYQIQRLCLDEKNEQFFQIRTRIAKENLISKANEVISQILSKCAEIVKHNVTQIGAEYQLMQTLLTKQPKKESELIDLKNYLAENDINLAKRKQEVDTVFSYLVMFETQSYSYDHDEEDKFWELHWWPQEIKNSVIEGSRKAQNQELKFMEQLENEKDKFLGELRELTEIFFSLKKFDDYNKVPDCAKDAYSLKDRLDNAQNKVLSFNERELLFRQPVSNYEDLNILNEEFSNYYRLWTLAAEFEDEKTTWTTGSFLKLIFGEIDSKVRQTYLKQANQLIKIFSDLGDDTAADVARKLKLSVEQFKEKLWLIELLTTEAMKTKLNMWNDIWRDTGLSEKWRESNQNELNPKDDLSLDALTGAGLLEHRVIIEEVSRRAEKLYTIEKNLQMIQDKLKEQKLEMLPFKKTGTYVLKSLDDVVTCFDEQFNLLMMLKAQPHIRFVQQKATTLEQRIVQIQDTLDNWIKVQRGWMYLEPIFSSEDIKKKMAAEKMKFERVDAHWRQVMEQFQKEPNIWDGIDTDKLKNEFEQDNKSLDQIQKSLSEYLETKRSFFPRFYFLSDEELLEILAQTKDPETVQKHINKCFEAIALLEFNPNQEVVAMISAEKEKVNFSKSINVNEGEKKGNVERWLLEIENVMIDTLKKIMRASLFDVDSKRTQWVRKWPAQIVLGVNMIRWTRGSEEAIDGVSKESGINESQVSAGGESSLQRFLNVLITDLRDIVELVRQDLSTLERLTLGALVVLDVHGRDVIRQLVRQGCKDIHNFAWIAQLRYYWHDTPNHHCKVSMINAVLQYGFEYLGNSLRLVITPLTDRCYRTLMGAFHLYYGGAPEGPAGTGKTETVKDLAKALAVQCVVFNCSDGLNYLAMSKFFKGLASSGAWCCFDEFNRIDLEVLSVIAQQVLTIQTAIREKKRVFTFDETEITLIPSCAINITMNPGYAGRSDLPDNLKALFRPCAMMVPDYALISEIYLYSVGFQDASNLARKIVASLRLSSEQLSSQDHYDFGMRALKAILTAAGNLKRVMNDIEDIICLRALMDVNIPKFTVNDVPLFNSITSDLFPGVKQPEQDYGALEQALRNICSQINIQPEKGFIEKCIQLFDTINVRHGLMVVGQAFSGKSKVLECLGKAMSSLKGTEKFVQCTAIKLNPKAVTSDQLYGKLDPDTKQWSDGVVAIIMRDCSKDAELEERKWIVFDGPVDAVWIENMNTVLDDNKKLCLTSGEIIKMTNWMTMMFEVEDLSQASPATVSRCGMVYLEAQQIGWLALVKIICKHHSRKTHREIIPRGHVEKYVRLQSGMGANPWQIPDLQKRNDYGKEFLIVDEWTEHDQDGKQKQINLNEVKEVLSKASLFALVWSLGGAMDEFCRKQFNLFLIKLISSEDVSETFNLRLQYKFQPVSISAKLQDKANLFDMVYDRSKNNFISWTQTQPPYVTPKGVEYNELLIPTSDSIRNNYFLHLCVKAKIHLLNQWTNRNRKDLQYYVTFNAEFTNLITAFSGQTLVNQVQKTIEGKVNSRKKKGYFGPEEGKKTIVIFIDDLNMPAKEKYGASTSNRWMDTEGWYDLDTKEPKYLQGIVFIASMLPPTGGRNVVTMRYLRHYHLLYVEPFEGDSLRRIFQNVLEWYYAGMANNPLPKSITNLRDNITCKELLPTPAKSHYVYNLRDISKVFQGISKTTQRSFKDDNDFIKLWAHECQRVFQDRLISIEDQNTFDKILKDILFTTFKRDWSSLVKLEPLLWASFVPTIYPDDDRSKRPYSDIYCELTDRDALRKVCGEQLAEYNNFYSSNRMDLVLFMNAIQHIIKIQRVITTSFGHCLLVGVGGSGRKSLATLASFIAFQNETFQVDARNWVEELQKVMKMGGIDQKETVFMYSDTQILKESMVEDICNILNNGEVPNLFPIEEKTRIIDEMSSYIQGTSNEKYGYFVKQCKKNLHLVICMSPVGEAFRRRLRTFPALVNCTTIDWFLPWPEEALRSTADTVFIKDLKITDNNLRAGLVDIAVDMQLRISELTKRFYNELRRYYYVTPTSYLELLATFKRLKTDRDQQMIKLITRYEAGVDKIMLTEKDVGKMQKELEELQPQLEKATIDNSQLLIQLQKKQKEADAKKQICLQDEKQCNFIRDDANKLKLDCQNDLDKVLPILEAASEALKSIKKEDIQYLKSLPKPPASAAIVMEGVCYVFNEDQNVKWQPKEPGSMEKVQDFWDYAKKSLLNDKLIKRVLDFKEDSIKAISTQKVQKLKQFIKNPLFEEEKVRNASIAALNLSMWIRAVVDTYEALAYQPNQLKLRKKLKGAEDQLAEKQAVLQEVMNFLAKLEADYNKAKSDKDTLEAKVNKCKIQLDNAEKLIKGLGGEKEAWKKKAADFKVESLTVIGDCILSSGIIAYLGAFSIAYREDAIKNWQNLLQRLNIQFSQDFQLQKILCDPITIGQWTNVYKLPNDSFSIDNAIILKNSTRWPLMIDPQGQANNWIKQMEMQNHLFLIKKGSTPVMQLKLAISNGQACLLEGIDEVIDNVFESILQKKIIQQGSSFKLKFGDEMIDYSTDFRFYMTTKLPRPHYSPEVCVKVTMLNFQVTLEGLEDQMLNIVVKIEEPQKEEQRQKNVKEFFENKNKQKVTEDLILQLLQESKGNLLDDVVLIETLQKSKIESTEIEEKLKKQEHDREQFNIIRNFYKDVAKRVANLYFVVLDLSLIEPTYQWSLESYIILFERSIREAIPGKDNRCKNIIDKFQISLYESICRALLEKDKLIFSFTLCLKIMQSENKISGPEVRFTMVGGTYSDPTVPIPHKDWISKKMWCTLCEANDVLPPFKGFIDSFITNIDKWQELYDSPEPHNFTLPAPWQGMLSQFQKLILIRIIRPDKFINAVQNLIIYEMSKQYMEPPQFNLEQAFKDADAFTPLIFILSPGADPRLEITNLAEKLGFKNNFSSLSLGQGQGKKAGDAIRSAAREGKWVLLQNCHLAPSYMPELEKLHEMEIVGQAAQTNSDFRIWLTSMPSSVFPVSLLMKGIKMTYEPPRGLKKTLCKWITRDLKIGKKPVEWKKLFFGLNFFHALCLERRKYGPLGWNIPYEFTSADLAISVSQLKMFLDEYDEIPWEALNYMVAEANYGGRVTDPKDRRLIAILLKQFYNEDVLGDRYKLSQNGVYHIPPTGQLEDYKEYIKNLPLNDQTEVFGLHSNAEISSAILETNSVTSTILSLLPRSVGGAGASAEDLIKEKCQVILKKLPQPFNIEEAQLKHPVQYTQSMNTVLQQELIRFQKLLVTLKLLMDLVVMSADLEQVFNKVFDNQVPDTWHKVSYPSLKPLGSWINDFLERLQFIQKWIDNGSPPNYWISGFFFTQSFLTGTLQNFARKYSIPIDTLSFEYIVIPPDSQEYDLTKTPEDGCYVYGLFLDGARWDEENRCLNESLPKVLISPVPYLWFLPTEEKRDYDVDVSVYECPVYKTSRRAGTLSTTGHSTNFVISIYIPLSPDHHPHHWVKRGVAMLTQTDD
ncbi:hypothetical protein pb186bvf_013648 [Paramecium bursaria]